MTTRQRLYEVLEGDWSSGRVTLFFNIFMVCLIVLNVLMVVFESMVPLRQAYGAQFALFEVFSVCIFLVEYVLRIAVATEDPSRRYRRPIVGRLRYALTPLALIDLLAILPFFLAVFGVADLRFLRAFRLLRLLKLARYFPAMQSLANVVKSQRRALLSASFVMFFMLVVSSSAMYLIERDEQPDAFGSIPAAMWWGVATLTTVGYGDVVPVTPVGRIVGTLIAMFGIGMFALPAAMLASGFSRENDKQDFLNTWHLVAALPVFRRLEAAEIAHVAELLYVRTAVPGEVLFRDGDLADNVYFILRGQVDVELGERRVRLEDGEFFGEMALLGNARRSATVRARTSCRFMVLCHDDFVDLCRDHPGLEQNFEEVAALRRSGG